MAAMPNVRIVLVFLVCATCIGSAPPASRSVTQADVDRWMTELSNWGRWGKQDQIGTVHLITDTKCKQAEALLQKAIRSH